jgi:hypothetical protein
VNSYGMWVSYRVIFPENHNTIILISMFAFWTSWTWILTPNEDKTRSTDTKVSDSDPDPVQCQLRYLPKFVYKNNAPGSFLH